MFGQWFETIFRHHFSRKLNLLAKRCFKSSCKVSSTKQRWNKQIVRKSFQIAENRLNSRRWFQDAPYSQNNLICLHYLLAMSLYSSFSFQFVSKGAPVPENNISFKLYFKPWVKKVLQENKIYHQNQTLFWEQVQSCKNIITFP